MMAASQKEKNSFRHISDHRPVKLDVEFYSLVKVFVRGSTSPFFKKINLDNIYGNY